MTPAAEPETASDAPFVARRVTATRAVSVGDVAVISFEKAVIVNILMTEMLPPLVFLKCWTWRRRRGPGGSLSIGRALASVESAHATTRISAQVVR